MKKIVRLFWIITALMLMFYAGVLIADKQALQTQIIRMHVIADSDNSQDQAVKLAVRDVLIQHLQAILRDVTDVSSVKSILIQELDVLEKLANQTLATLDSNDSATVILLQEEFDRREYDTFSLPAGIYESLCVRIGSGEGKNWWCVVFPSLCIPTTPDGFEATAVSSGFEEGLAGALSKNGSHTFRFYLLDCIGRIENFLNIS